MWGKVEWEGLRAELFVGAQRGRIPVFGKDVVGRSDMRLSWRGFLWEEQQRLVEKIEEGKKPFTRDASERTKEVKFDAIMGGLGGEAVELWKD
jgi:hypothetical protein